MHYNIVDTIFPFGTTYTTCQTSLCILHSSTKQYMTLKSAMLKRIDDMDEVCSSVSNLPALINLGSWLVHLIVGTEFVGVFIFMRSDKSKKVAHIEN